MLAHVSRTESTATAPALEPAPNHPWWRDAVVYQVYVRSFADANGDGVGDLAGVRSRLPYLRELGVDALWFSPWYPSPLADSGYDISDYRSIDPALGTLEQAEQLIGEAGRLASARSSTFVPNTSRTSIRGSRQPSPRGRARLSERDFVFRAGTGENGERPPNGWQSISAARPGRARGEEGDWYLHSFCPGAADLNWEHPDVWAEHEEILRILVGSRGAAGVRIDSAALLVKEQGLPEMSPENGPGEHPYIDRDELHEIYRSCARDREQLSGAAGSDRRNLASGRRALRARYLRLGRAPHCVQLRLPRVSVGAGPDASLDRRFARRARAGGCARDLGALQPRRHAARHTLRPLRHVIRIRKPNARGRRRISSAARGAHARRRCSRWRFPARCTSTRAKSSACRKVENIPSDRRQDPMWLRSGGVDPGRDGCRVPLPWSGFGAAVRVQQQRRGRPWLDQPDDWAPLTVEAQEHDPASMLSLYRAGLRARRDAPWARMPSFTGSRRPTEVIAFGRGSGSRARQ